MVNKSTTCLVLIVLGATFLITITYAQDTRRSYVRIVTPDDDKHFLQNLRTLLHSPGSENRFQLNGIEIGRSYYDYISNTQLGRMMANAYSDSGFPVGAHLAFMKIYPTPASERIVTYDYFDYGLNVFLGNHSIDETLGRTGWPKVLNGRENEAIVAFHANDNESIHIYKDISRAAFSFESVLDISNSGAPHFPGIAHSGDHVVFMSQLANNSYLGPDTLVVSFDYMSNWSAGTTVDIASGSDDSDSERWPSINPTNPYEFSFIYSQDTSANSIDGESILATSFDFGMSYSTVGIHEDGEINPDNSQYFIEDFKQWSGFYSQNGIYHAVAGAVQGYRDWQDTSQVNIFPIVYWNNSTKQLSELTSTEKGRPSDPDIQTALVDLRSGNGLGNSHPMLTEGPDGELMAVWQQWEENGNGEIVTIIGTGGDEIFMTDIWGAYSPDGGISWSEPFFVAGTPGESDIFPNLPERAFWNESRDSLLVDLVYFWDPDPGTSLFAENNPSEGLWYYQRVAFSATPADGPRIVTVDPDSAYPGQIVSTQIMGLNTQFEIDGKTTDTVWLSRIEEVIEADSVEVLNPTNLVAHISVPESTTLDFWTINIEQVGGSGTVSLINGFKISEKVLDSLTFTVPMIDAFAADTIIIPIGLHIPQDSSIAQAKLFISGFHNDIEFLQVTTEGTLVGDAGWTVESIETDSLLIINVEGLNDINTYGNLFALNMRIPETSSVGFVPITLDSAIFNSSQHHTRLFSGGVEIILPNPGDVDQNSVVQAFDASFILRYLVGLIELTPTQLANANVSPDTTVSALDADIILQYVVGLLDSLPSDSLFAAEGNMVMNDLKFIPGEITEVPLYLTNSFNTHSFEAELMIEPADVQIIDVLWGEILQNVSHQQNLTVNRIMLAGSGTIPNTTADLFLTLKLLTESDFSLDTITVKLEKLRLNEEAVLINPAQSILSNPTGILAQTNSVPKEYSLRQNYPNPFNSSTLIEYELSKSIDVTLSIYNILGQEVVVLVGEFQDAAQYSVRWDGSDFANQPVPTGIYIYRLNAGEYRKSLKLLIIK